MGHVEGGVVFVMQFALFAKPVLAECAHLASGHLEVLLVVLIQCWLAGGAPLDWPVMVDGYELHLHAAHLLGASQHLMVLQDHVEIRTAEYLSNRRITAESLPLEHGLLVLVTRRVVVLLAENEAGGALGAVRV